MSYIYGNVVNANDKGLVRIETDKGSIDELSTLILHGAGNVEIFADNEAKEIIVKVVGDKEAIEEKADEAPSGSAVYDYIKKYTLPKTAEGTIDCGKII